MRLHFSIGNKHIFLLTAVMILFLLATDQAFATTTTGGGLPFDSWFTKLQKSITGPFAFTAAIVGLIGSGVGLIFGGDMNGALRMMLYIVFVLAFIIAADSTITAITGKGAEIGPTPVANDFRKLQS